MSLMSPRAIVHNEALRQSLIRCTAAAIADSGYAAVSVRRLAAMAGTSTTAIYSLFGSKESLLQQVVEAASTSFMAAQAAVTDTDGDRLKHLHALGLAYREWALEHPDLYRLMAGTTLPDPTQGAHSFAAVERAIMPLLATLQAAMDEGILDSEHRPGDIAISMWSYLHGFTALEAAQWQLIPLEDRNRLFRKGLEAQWAAWRPGTATTD